MSEHSAQENVTAPTRRGWISLPVLSVGLGIIVLDGTIVGVALPSSITDLQLNLTQAHLPRRPDNIRGRQRIGGIFYLRRHVDLRASCAGYRRRVHHVVHAFDR
ncbi:hypothetical protein ACUY3J_05410 [Corynebacterium segmentosum]